MSGDSREVPLALLHGRRELAFMTLRDAVSRNQILSSMPASELSSFEPHLSLLTLTTGDALLDRTRTIDCVYFPVTALISLRSGDGPKCPETAVVGAEGLVGVSVFLGVAMPFERAIVLQPGTVVSMPAAAFAATLATSPATERLVRRFAQAQLETITQSSVCIGRHSVVERCAREILLLDDRVESGELQLTHLLLSEVLGVRRPSVTIAAEALREAGAIEYGRRRIRVRNRAKLESMACGCYATLRTIADRLAIDHVTETPPASSRASGPVRPELAHGAVSPRAIQNFFEVTRSVKERAASWASGSADLVTPRQYQDMMRDMGSIISHLEIAQEEMRAQIEALEEMRYTLEQRASANRTLLDGLPDAFVQTNAAGNITELNTAAEALLGRPRHQALGKPIAALVELKDRGSLRRIVGGSPTTRWQGSVLRGGGARAEPLAVECSVAKVSARDGEGIRWLMRPTA